MFLRNHMGFVFARASQVAHTASQERRMGAGPPLAVDRFS